MQKTRLAEWLQEQITKHEWSVRTAARKAGLSNTTLNEVLNHGHIPKPAVIGKLAAAFEVDEDTAMEVAGYIRLPDIAGDIPEEAKELLRRLYRLSVAERQFVFDLLGSALRFLETRTAPDVSPDA